MEKEDKHLDPGDLGKDLEALASGSKFIYSFKIHFILKVHEFCILLHVCIVL